LQGSEKNVPGMNPSAERKSLLRQRLRQELRQLPAEVRAEASAQIRRTLTAQDFWKDAVTILAFVPMPTEPDIWEAVVTAAAQGRRICLPRYQAATDRYLPALV